MSSGSEWLKCQGVEMSDFGVKVADLVGDLFQGIYHIGKQAMKANWDHATWVKLNVSDSHFATYDSSLLTHLVILAHTRNIRISVEGAAPGYLRLKFMAVTQSGFFADSHPTLLESLEKFGATLQRP